MSMLTAAAAIRIMTSEMVKRRVRSGCMRRLSSPLERPLPPRDRHGWGLPVQVAADVLRARVKPRDEAHELADGFLVGLLALFGSRQFRVAQDARRGIAAGPGDDCGRAGGEEVDPLERAGFLVEADDAALDQVLADVSAVEIEIHRRLQLARVRTAAGELALAPSGH